MSCSFVSFPSGKTLSVHFQSQLVLRSDSGVEIVAPFPSYPIDWLCSTTTLAKDPIACDGLRVWKQTHLPRSGLSIFTVYQRVLAAAAATGDRLDPPDQDVSPDDSGWASVLIDAWVQPSACGQTCERTTPLSYLHVVSLVAAVCMVHGVCDVWQSAYLDDAPTQTLLTSIRRIFSAPVTPSAKSFSLVVQQLERLWTSQCIVLFDLCCIRYVMHHLDSNDACDTSRSYRALQSGVFGSGTKRRFDTLQVTAAAAAAAGVEEATSHQTMAATESLLDPPLRHSLPLFYDEENTSKRGRHDSTHHIDADVGMPDAAAAAAAAAAAPSASSSSSSSSGMRTWNDDVFLHRHDDAPHDMSLFDRHPLRQSRTSNHQPLVAMSDSRPFLFNVNASSFLSSTASSSSAATAATAGASASASASDDQAVHHEDDDDLSSVDLENFDVSDMDDFDDDEEEDTALDSGFNSSDVHPSARGQPRLRMEPPVAATHTAPQHHQLPTATHHPNRAPAPTVMQPIHGTATRMFTSAEYWIVADCVRARGHRWANIRRTLLRDWKAREIRQAWMDTLHQPKFALPTRPSMQTTDLSAFLALSVKLTPEEHWAFYDALNAIGPQWTLIQREILPRYSTSRLPKLWKIINQPNFVAPPRPSTALPITVLPVAIRNAQKKPFPKRRSFTPAEYWAVSDALQQVGAAWTMIRSKLLPDWDAQHIRHKWESTRHPNFVVPVRPSNVPSLDLDTVPSKHAGRALAFTPAEYWAVSDARAQYGNNAWDKIRSVVLPHCSEQAIQRVWQQTQKPGFFVPSRPDLRAGPRALVFTPDEFAIVSEAVQRLGTKWSVIQSLCMPAWDRKRLAKAWENAKKKPPVVRGVAPVAASTQAVPHEMVRATATAAAAASMPAPTPPRSFTSAEYYAVADAIKTMGKKWHAIGDRLRMKKWTSSELRNSWENTILNPTCIPNLLYASPDSPWRHWKRVFRYGPHSRPVNVNTFAFSLTAPRHVSVSVHHLRDLYEESRLIPFPAADMPSRALMFENAFAYAPANFGFTRHAVYEMSRLANLLPGFRTFLAQTLVPYLVLQESKAVSATEAETFSTMP